MHICSTGKDFVEKIYVLRENTRILINSLPYFASSKFFSLSQKHHCAVCSTPLDGEVESCQSIDLASLLEMKLFN